MDRLGHAHIQTTQKYLHALAEADQRNLDALNKMTRDRPQRPDYTQRAPARQRVQQGVGG